MCLYPQVIRNARFSPNQKNKGIVPEMQDKRVLMVPVSCGECMECKKRKARDWQIRLSEEIRHNKDGKFVTLSFSDESINELIEAIEEDNKKIEKLHRKAKNGLSGYNLDNEIATVAVRRFLERWRKKYKVSARHWVITELGQKGTERIHIHGIIFTKESNETIEKIWKYGHIYVGDYVSERTINYIVKYVSKTDEKHKNYKSKVLASKGIGKGYVEREGRRVNAIKENGKTNEQYTTRTGVKLPLPIYYRNKIYTEEEREKLWVEKLNKNVRYVDGIEISVDKDHEHYYKALKEARKKSKRLGYGDNMKNWSKKKYENIMRIMKQEQRRIDSIKKKQ